MSQDTRKTVLVGLMIVAAVVVLYGRVAGHEFVNYDDGVYVMDNPIVREGLSWRGLAWAWSDSSAGIWHPLTWLSHMLDCEMFGVNPAGHHAVSVVLHALNALLLLVLLRRTTGALWPSAFVAAMFALHPLRVESVAWISERKDVLSGFFWMAASLAYVRYARAPGVGRYALVLACTALGLMVKPMLVTLPFVFLLLDVWPLGRIRQGVSLRPAVGRLLVEKIPLLLLSAAASWIAAAFQRSASAVASVEALSPASRVANALVAYVVYLRQTVWPAGLACFYPHPALAGGTTTGLFLKGAGAGLVLLALTVLALLAVARRPHVTVGWLWYVGTLVPVIGLVQIGDQAFADRYTYLPQIGVAILVAWGLAEAAARLPRGRIPTLALAVALLAGWSSVTWIQVGYWRSSRTLWERALRVTTENFIAHNNLGNALLREGRMEAARAQYELALRVRPDYGRAHNNLGVLYERQGDPELARRHYEASVALRPDDVTGHRNLGILLQKQGDPQGARVHLQQAANLAPDDAGTRNRLGVVLGRLGLTDRAEQEFAAALRLDPANADAHANLGYLFEIRDDPDRAAAEYRRALAVDPGLASAHANLGLLLDRLGDWRQAVRHLRLALANGSTSLDVADRLAWILATSRDDSLRDGAEALEWAGRCAAATDHRNAGILATLAAAHAESGDFAEAVRWQERAVDLAASDRRAEFRSRLEVYRADRPLRDGPRRTPQALGLSETSPG